MPGSCDLAGQHFSDEARCGFTYRLGCVLLQEMRALDFHRLSKVSRRFRETGTRAAAAHTFYDSSKLRRNSL
jgi:hypothetical protein